MSASMKKENKIDGGEAKKNRSWTPKSKQFRAPTPGLKTFIFRHRKNEYATEFVKTQTALSQYCGTTFKEGGPNLATAIQNLTPPMYNAPGDPKITPPHAKPTYVQHEIWKTNYAKYTKNIDSWATNNCRFYHLMLSHIDHKTEEKLKSMPGWDVAERADDSIAVLGLLKNIIYSHEQVQTGTMAYIVADIKVFTLYQFEKREMAHTSPASSPVSRSVRASRAMWDFMTAFVTSYYSRRASHPIMQPTTKRPFMASSHDSNTLLVYFSMELTMGDIGR